MNKFLFSFVLFSGFAFAFISCKPNVLKGEGAKGKNNPTVGSFTSIRIDVPLKATINVAQGSAPAVEFEGYQNVLKHIMAKTENNELIIYTDLDETWTMDEESHTTARITLPAFMKLTLEGAPDAEVHGNITGGEFGIEISGASSVKLDNVSVDSFNVEVSGAADVEVKGGTVKYAGYDINGTGDIKAFPLQANEVEATISGAGSSEVYAQQKLGVNISGAGTIKYKGHPAVSQEVSGAGTITDAN